MLCYFCISNNLCKFCWMHCWPREISGALRPIWGIILGSTCLPDTEERGGASLYYGATQRYTDATMRATVAGKNGSVYFGAPQRDASMRAMQIYK